MFVLHVVRHLARTPKLETTQVTNRIGGSTATSLGRVTVGSRVYSLPLTAGFARL